MTTYLATLHAHPRDTCIQFVEETHSYIVNEPDTTVSPPAKYTSTTTWIHGMFPKFDADAVIENMTRSKKWGPDHKYWGMTAAQIKTSWNTGTAAKEGQRMHAMIEEALNLSEATTNADLSSLLEIRPCPNGEFEHEWSLFMRFLRDHGHLKPYRTEWYIFDETSKIAGSIDAVFQNTQTGELSIYDWKRSKEILPDNNWGRFGIEAEVAHLPDTNYWHYALQLNIYKYILETRYGLTPIVELVLIRLHPNTDTYERIVLPDLTREVARMMRDRQRKHYRACICSISDLDQYQVNLEPYVTRLRPLHKK